MSDKPLASAAEQHAERAAKHARAALQSASCAVVVRHAGRAQREIGRMEVHSLSSESRPVDGGYAMKVADEALDWAKKVCKGGRR
jgi:hypothetical protein